MSAWRSVGGPIPPPTAATAATIAIVAIAIIPAVAITVSPACSPPPPAAIVVVGLAEGETNAATITTVAIAIVPAPPSFHPSSALLTQEPHEVDRAQRGVRRDYHVHRPPSRRLPPTPLLLRRRRRGVGQESIDDRWRQPLHDGLVAVGGKGQKEDAIAPVHEVVGLPVRARYSSQSSSSLRRFHLLRSSGSALDAIVVIPSPEQPRSMTVRRPPGANADAMVAMDAIGVECCVWD